jgi:hypothetical protein
VFWSRNILTARGSENFLVRLQSGPSVSGFRGPTCTERNEQGAEDNIWTHYGGNNISLKRSTQSRALELVIILHQVLSV